MRVKRKKNFVVIGLGRFGATVAQALTKMGDEVLAIDTDEKLARQFANEVSHVVIADAKDKIALQEAGVKNYDVAVIAIGDDLEANILATMNVKYLGIETIWVKAQSDTHRRILSRIGVDRVIRPERDMGLQIAETLHTSYAFDYINLGYRRYLVSFIIRAETKELTLAKLTSYNSKSFSIVGLMRENEFIAFKDISTDLQEGDRLLAVGSKDELNKLSELF
ncbi:TrkA family potassium uptake protein [Thiotrichales bacterium 19S3-7]|nr:TrkA family potassium uptake protein [Thiotrichales bacterium 19S3-7]MCF6801661.1 TrkA family potassium uptake protein [Thiotrichales bacterium 19S3-11]